MTVLVIALVALAIKLPVLAACWYIYRAIHDVPEPEIDGDGGDFVKADFEPGPRRRGPHDGKPEVASQPRRGDKGHDESVPKPLVGSGSSAR